MLIQLLKNETDPCFGSCSVLHSETHLRTAIQYDGIKCCIDRLVFSSPHETPLASIVVFVDTHECGTRKVWNVASNTAIGVSLIPRSIAR